MLGLPSLAVSAFFRGIVWSGTIEGKAQKILVSLRKKKFEFHVFFLKKKYFFFNLLVFDFFSKFDLVCVIDTEAGMNATDGDAWTEQVLSEGTNYNWPWGTRALIAERKRVQDIQVLQGLFEYGLYVNHTDPGIFKCPLSFEEAFVSSDTQRIALMNRLRFYYNINWERDATERARRGHHGNICSTEELFKQQFCAMKREADKLFKKHIEDLLLLQALTEELMPETRELIKHCTSFEELLRCMLDAKVV